MDFLLVRAGQAVLRRSAGIIAALALVVAGCASVASTSTIGPSASPIVAASPAVAQTTKGPFLLQLELPRTDWRTTETITGDATLSLVGISSLQYGSNGNGPIIFSIDEVGGSRKVDPVITADCRYRTMDAAEPLVAPIKTLQEWVLSDHEMQLPVGTWRITATALVNPNGMCPDDMKASVEVRVTP
jgi:hypothetical protein